MLGVVLLSGAGLLAVRPGSGPGETVGVERVRAGYGSIPLHFEVNEGQADERVQFLSRGDGYALLLTADEAVLGLRNAGSVAKDGDRSRVLRMRLKGASRTARARAIDPLPGRVNYLLGNDPRKWRRNVRTHGRVRYDEVYPGIDLVYYGNQRQLEYDFVVAPGADPGKIRVAFQGADEAWVDAGGELALRFGEGEVRQRRPVAYQESAEGRRMVRADYALAADGEVRFELGEYDPSRPLVIDPVITYSTLLGGAASEVGQGIALDAAGSAYVTGQTLSNNFDTTVGAFQTTFGGNIDAFVTKVNSTGTALVYSTYVGGNNLDNALDIAVDGSGRASLVGGTSSANFPTMNAFDASLGALSDGFASTLSADGSSLVYSTYVGGSQNDMAFGAGVDGSGNLYVSGQTGSPDFPTLNPFQAALNGGDDGFIMKLDPTAAGAASLLYSTYFGGSLGGEFVASIVVDADANIYVAGGTPSGDFPTANPVQADPSASNDAFVSKLSADGQMLVFSTYLGGSLGQNAADVAIDAMRNVYVTGTTGSPDFPVVNAFQPTFGGGEDGFLVKLNAAGSMVVYTTFLGGSNSDNARSVAVSPGGNAYVVGFTNSTNFPTICPLQASRSGSDDYFVTKLNPAGLGLFSSYLGGAATKAVQGPVAAVDANENVFITGGTNSSNFPTTSGAFQTALEGARDAFVIKIATATEGVAPTVTSCGVTPPALPQEGGAVMIAAGATDNDMVCAVTARILQPDGSTVVQRLFPQGGGFQGNFTAPANPGSTTQTYNITIEAVDPSGNIGVGNCDFTVAGSGGGGDTTPPALNNCQITPGSRGSSGGPFTIQVDASDPGFVVEVTAIVGGPSTDGAPAPNGSNGQVVTLSRIAGTLQEGTYRGVFNAPPNTAGVTQIYSVTVSAMDKSSNSGEEFCGTFQVLPAGPPPAGGGGDVWGRGIVDASAIGVDRFGSPHVGTFNAHVYTLRNGRPRGEVNFTVSGVREVRGGVLRMRSTRISSLSVFEGSGGPAARGGGGGAGRVAVVTGTMRIAGLGQTSFQAIFEDNGTPGVPSDRFLLTLGSTGTFKPAGNGEVLQFGGNLLLVRDRSLGSDIVVRESIFAR
jgi:hypothetical protein